MQEARKEKPKKQNRQASSSPAGFGRSGGTRTRDLCVPNAALYQLSHTPIDSACCALGQIRTADL